MASTSAMLDQSIFGGGFQTQQNAPGFTPQSAQLSNPLQNYHPANTQQVPSANTQTPTNYNVPGPNGNMGNIGGGSPTNQNPTTPPAPSGPSPEQQLIDQNFNDINNYLGGLQNSAYQGYQSIQQGINSGYDTSQGNLNRSQGAAEQQIGQSQQQGEQRKQDALVAAQRLYNELIQGGQQRFGGASSAGEAYQALTGRELQRNNQATQNDYSTFMGQIATAKNNLQMQYQNALATLNQNRQDALRQAEADYQSKLDQINSSRTQAQTDKNNAKLQLLQELRNNVYNINVANAQNSGTLANTLKQYQDQLAQAEAQIGAQVGNVNQGQQAYNTNVNLNPTTELSMNTQGGGQSFSPTGQIASQTGNRDRFGNLLYATA